MTNELIGQAKNWIWAKVKAVAKALMPEFTFIPGEKAILVASDGNVMDMGKRYRLTSGHSPLFSLFTFFGLR